MKIAFIYGGYENLGIEYLSACLKREGHETSLIFDPRLFDDNYTHMPTLARWLTREEEVREAVQASDADVFCFSVVTDDYLWAKGLAALVKKHHPERPVIFGGIHPSTVPARVLRSGVVDYVVMGEGEKALPLLVSAIEKGMFDLSIPGVGCLKEGAVSTTPPAPPAQPLDELPWPDKELFYERLPYLTRDYRIVTSRGCLFSCSYCCNDFLKKLYRGRPSYRVRSVESVIEELKDAKARWGMRRVQFFDDLFAPDREWLKYFCFLYGREIGLPFWCSVSPSTVSAESVRLLAEAGCCEVQMGVQSMNEGLRREILMRRESNEEVRKAIHLIRDAGIKLVVDNISGIPGESDDDLLASLAFYNEHRPSRVSDYALRYYPGTGIMKYAREMGVLSDQDVEELEEGRGSRSFALGGTGARSRSREALRFMLRIFHLFPAKLVAFVLKHGLWRLLPANPFVVSAMLRMLQVFTGKDINAERYVSRYWHFLLQRSGPRRS